MDTVLLITSAVGFWGSYMTRSGCSPRPGFILNRARPTSTRAVPVLDVGGPFHVMERVVPALTAYGWSADVTPGAGISRLVRRALIRSCVTRATPAMATARLPPTAAMNSAIPSGRDPAKPR